jgi:CBS domain-containing protein
MVTMRAFDWTHLRARETRVDEIMSPATVTVGEHDSVLQASVTLLRNGVSGAPVVDAHGHLVGVLTHSDVLAKFAAPRERRSNVGRLDDRHDRAVTAGDACSRPAVTTSPDATVDTVARELLDRDIGRIVVVDEDRIVGVVGRADVVGLVLSPPEPDDGAATGQPGDAGPVHRRPMAPQRPPD